MSELTSWVDGAWHKFNGPAQAVIGAQHAPAAYMTRCIPTTGALFLFIVT
jgi:hypothetical protein